METLELALELRRAGYGEHGERLGFDLYPYTEDAGRGREAVGAAVALHRRRSPRRSTSTALREAQSAQGRRPRVRARLRGARSVRLQHVSVAIPPDGVDRAREFYGSLLGLEERDVLPTLDPSRFVWYRAGGDLELHLMRVDERPPERAHFCLVVDGDLDALRARLERRRHLHQRRLAARRTARASSAATRSGTRSNSAGWIGSLLVGLDVGTSGVKGIAISPDGRVLARAEEATALSTPRPGWAEQDPEDWWRAAQAVLARAAGGAGRALGADARARRASTQGERVLRPAILWNDQRTGGGVRRDRGTGRARAADRADRQPRAHGIHGAEAALAAPARAGGLRADPPRAAAEGLRAAAARAASTRSTPPTPRGRCSSTSPAAAGRRRCCAALELPRDWLPRRSSRPRSRRRRRPGGRRARRRRRPAGAALGRARHLRRRLRGAAGVRGRPAGARARLLPRACPAPGTRWA